MLQKIMYSLACIVTIICYGSVEICRLESNQETIADAHVTVVGAGPAGIITVAELLAQGVKPENIRWIDNNKFNVGRMGEYYTTVPANNKTKLFIRFVQRNKIFQECSSAAVEALYSYDQECEYPLKIIVDVLQEFTHCIIAKGVIALETSLTALNFTDHAWHVTTPEGTFTSHIVILATGAHPHSLNYPVNNEIPLDIALAKHRLAQEVCPLDSIAVVGSAHSAALVLKSLTELPVFKIVHFYNRPFNYICEKKNCLMGVAADWVKNVLEKNPPSNLMQIQNNEENRTLWLPHITKIIYAVGFQRNQLPPINGALDATYDDTNGTIAPGLFGIGIAFPERIITEDGAIEHRVGINAFLDYAQAIIPTWLNKHPNEYAQEFEELFMIHAL